MSCACASGDQRIALKLINKYYHNEETMSLEFAIPDQMVWKDGDHCKVFVKTDTGELGKKFSFATIPQEGVIRFTTRVQQPISDYKAVLSRLEIGQEIEISQASGGFNLRRDGSPVVLLSNGVGIAASRSLFFSAHLDARSIPMVHHINVDSGDELYGQELFKVTSDNLKLSAYYERNRYEFYKRLDESFKLFKRQFALEPYYHIVGSPKFVSACLDHLLKRGISKESMITDTQSEGGGTCGCGFDTSLVDTSFSNHEIIALTSAKAI